MSSFYRSLFLALIAASGQLWGIGLRAEARAAVGNVTLVLGKAFIVHPQGSSSRAVKGSTIAQGDSVQTAQGGHVHIRFVDGALVSVRPASQLTIQEYIYRPDAPEQSQVRFRLEQGVTRAISGAAAEGARERFRLNTPLVAIGVRGTDFVVRAYPQTTFASVNQGAIIMAPLGQGCQAQSLGPCAVNAQLLTADIAGGRLEYQPSFAQPMLREMQPSATTIPVVTAVATASAQEKSLTASEKNDAATLGGVVLQVSLQHFGESMASLPAQPSYPDPKPQPPAQLAWGRWASDGSDTLATTRELASVERQVSVGNHEFALYRQQDVASQLSPALGTLGFALQQSQARFTSASGAVQTASVLGGQLQLNFAARTFDTSLNLYSQSSGVAGLQAHGYLSPEGIFFDRSQIGQTVAGAVALDAKTAGYLFEKAVNGGQLSGITLWGRP